MYQQEMIDFVNSHESIISLWIDNKGDWHTSKVPNAKEVTRAEIIGDSKPSKTKKVTDDGTK